GQRHADAAGKGLVLLSGCAQREVRVDGRAVFISGNGYLELVVAVVVRNGHIRDRYTLFIDGNDLRVADRFSGHAIGDLSTEGHGRKAAIIVVIDSCARQTRVAKSLIRVAGPTVLGQATSALGIVFGHLALGATRASPIDEGVSVG